MAASIPVPRCLTAKQIRRELCQTCVTLLAGMTSSGAVVVPHAVGLAKLSTAAAVPSVLLAWVAAGIIFNDAWF